MLVWDSQKQEGETDPQSGEVSPSCLREPHTNTKDKDYTHETKQRYTELYTDTTYPVISDL